MPILSMLLFLFFLKKANKLYKINLNQLLKPLFYIFLFKNHLKFFNLLKIKLFYYYINTFIYLIYTIIHLSYFINFFLL